MANQANLQLIVSAQDKASETLKKVGDQTDALKNNTNSLSDAFKAAAGALSAYAGIRGLTTLINSTLESQKTLAQARFFLAGFTKDTDSGMVSLQAFGKEMEKTIGASDEYATLIAARLAPRIKNLNKAKEYASVLLRGERIGVLNAADAANMMIRATEGNTRALRFLLEQMGISVPEFASLDTMFQELSAHIAEGEKSLSPFVTQWARLKETFGDFMENAGTPLVKWAAIIFEKINAVIERWPILGQIISIAMIAIAGALAIAGIAALASFMSPMLTAIMTVGSALAPLLLNPWTLAIGLIIALILLIYFKWDQIKDGLLYVWEVLRDNAKFFWTAIKEGVGALSDALVSGLRIAWEGFKNFWISLWDAIKDAVTSAWNWISDKVNAIVSMVSNAINAVKNLPSSAGSVISNVVGKVTGRAVGGPVAAGTPYVVGERGPELFIPRMAGSIVPNGGGGVMVDMRGSLFLDRNIAVEIGDMIIDRLKEMHRLGL